VRWLTYPELATELGLTRSTLNRRLNAHNRQAQKEGRQEFKPDHKERTEGASRHLFKAEHLPAIKAALENTPVARRGRPRKGDTPS